jgi:hypothetical protein
MAMAIGASGDLLVGGPFTIAGGAVSAYVATIRTTCPASAVPYGAGCASSAGPVSLTTTGLPWIGSTFTSTVNGMPASALGLAVWGVNQVGIGLPTILPQGVVGCSLLASPDLLVMLLPAGGTAQSQLVLPNSAALVAQTLYHQAIALELNAASAITAVTGSNGLMLWIGSF